MSLQQTKIRFGAERTLNERHECAAQAISENLGWGGGGRYRPGNVAVRYGARQVRGRFEQSTLGHADRHREMCGRLQRLRDRMQQGKRLVRRVESDGLAVDAQGRAQGYARRPDIVTADDVPALR